MYSVYLLYWYKSTRTDAGGCAAQTIYLSTNLLNQCLANPLPPMSASCIYDGEFIHRFHHLQQRVKGMSALEDQLRKDKIEWKPFYELYQLLAAGTQFICFTSTNVQTLTPAVRRRL